MSKVFVGGSRLVTRLPALAIERLDNIIEAGHHVIIGDANGADKAVQKYLSLAGYGNVTIFCSGNAPRNNLGAWPLQTVMPDRATRGFQFYAAKDRIMAQHADFGLMIWDGKSAGTILNLLRLLQGNKKAFLINVPETTIRPLKSMADWEDFLVTQNAALKTDLQERATPDEWPRTEVRQASFL